MSQDKEKRQNFFFQNSDTKKLCSGLDQVEIIVILLPVSVSYV